MSMRAMTRFFMLAWLFGCLTACGATPFTGPTTEPDLGAPLPFNEAPAPPARIVRIPNPNAPCPLNYVPKDIGNVLVIPGAWMARAMKPTLAAVCACTVDGDQVSIVTVIDFAAGNVEISAPEDEAIDRCVAGLPGTFEPIPESELPGSDCIDCGPRRYGVFPSGEPAEPKPKGGLKVRYPFRVDRRSEAEKGKAQP